MRTILTVVRSDGEMFYHSRGKLRSCWSNPNWREQATKFKTMEHAVRVAPKKYTPRLAYENATEGTYLSHDLKTWTATTIEENQQ